jgi:hypothetical protein
MRLDPSSAGLEPKGTSMLAVQIRPLARVRARSVRRAFHPSAAGPYRLPHDIRDRLSTALMPYRNRDAAFALAVFLARFWSVPGRVTGAFPIDRRALAEHQVLELTEARVRGAIRVLEEIGFLTRAIPASGSRYKATAGGLQRKPILFTFGAEYLTAFVGANKRAAAARGRRSGGRRGHAAPTVSRPLVGLPEGSQPKSPKAIGEAVPVVLMGEVARGCRGRSLPQAPEPDPCLQAALDRLRRAGGFA